MDFNANHHGLDTPDALPESVERMRADSERTHSLLRKPKSCETVSRFDETTHMATDANKDRPTTRRMDSSEAALISG